MQQKPNKRGQQWKISTNHLTSHLTLQPSSVQNHLFKYLWSQIILDLIKCSSEYEQCKLFIQTKISQPWHTWHFGSENCGGLSCALYNNRQYRLHLPRGVNSTLPAVTIRNVSRHWKTASGSKRRLTPHWHLDSQSKNILSSIVEGLMRKEGQEYCKMVINREAY